MTRKHASFWLAATLVLVGLVYLWSQGEVITLRAEEGQAVRRSPVKPALGSNMVHLLSPDEQAEVLKCEDIKTDLVILVRLDSGESGYVSYGLGHFTLERRPLSLRSMVSQPGRITFSCKGMFEHPVISRYLK